MLAKYHSPPQVFVHDFAISTIVESSLVTSLSNHDGRMKPSNHVQQNPGLHTTLKPDVLFNCQARSQGPRIFSRWQPLFRASSKCLRPVSIMLATATPQSPAMKRPFENLEPYNYPHRQTENLHDTKTSLELERLRSLHA